MMSMWIFQRNIAFSQGDVNLNVLFLGFNVPLLVPALGFNVPLLAPAPGLHAKNSLLFQKSICIRGCFSLLCHYLGAARTPGSGSTTPYSSRSRSRGSSRWATSSFMMLQLVTEQQMLFHYLRGAPYSWHQLQQYLQANPYSSRNWSRSRGCSRWATSCSKGCSSLPPRTRFTYMIY